MGMQGELQALTSRQVEALRANPDMVSDIPFAHSDGNAETLFDEPLRESLDLENSWDILRFLMNKAGGQDGPDRKDWSSELLCADEDLGAEDIDMGYGPPYLRSIEETKKFASFLQSVDLDRLLSHLNCPGMLKEKIYGVYPARNPDEEKVQERGLREYASGYFPLLRDYVVKAAAAECALLLWIS